MLSFVTVECGSAQFVGWLLCVSYHLDDVIVGTINFLLVRIKLKQMELAIVRTEFTDNGSGFSLCLSS